MYKRLTGGALVLLLASALLSIAQQAGQTVPQPGSQQEAPPSSQGSSSKAANTGKQRYSHANDFLVRGTVFTDRALAFPGVELRIRRSGEKKFRWQDYTNSRGEFAMRVPRGAEYELVVRVKGFAEQSRTFEAKKGLTEETVVFRMEPAGEDKK